jgi:hypothetical protein
VWVSAACRNATRRNLNLGSRRNADRLRRLRPSLCSPLRAPGSVRSNCPLAPRARNRSLNRKDPNGYLIRRHLLSAVRSNRGKSEELPADCSIAPHRRLLLGVVCDPARLRLSPGGTSGGILPSAPERKKCWVAAIDIDHQGKLDPSHPAFYLPGQNLTSSRAGWLDRILQTKGGPCRSNRFSSG